MLKYVKMIHDHQKTWDESTGISPKMTLMQMYRGCAFFEYAMQNLPVAKLTEMLAYLDKFEATYDFCFDYFKSEKTDNGDDFCVINKCCIFIVEEPQATAFKFQYATKRDKE